MVQVGQVKLHKSIVVVKREWTKCLPMCSNPAKALG
jgi:hypothetical protein